MYGSYCEQSGKLHTMDLMLLTLFGVRAAGSIQIRSNRNATQKSAQKGWHRTYYEMDTADSGRATERARENEKIYIYFRRFVHIAPTMSSRLCW